MPNFIDPRMQMPRGDGFGQQGGYQGQVYNSPQPQQSGGWQSPMEQGMQQSFPQMPVINQQTGAVNRLPMQPPMPQQNGMGRMYPQLSPQDIEMFRKLQRQQEIERELEQMYMQEKMKGMLSGQ